MKAWVGVAWDALLQRQGCASHALSHDSMLLEELADPVIREAFDYEMALIQPLWSISKRGVAVDHEAC
jgi:hypothetical protein